MKIMSRLQVHILSIRQEPEEHGRISRTTLLMMMFFGQKLQQPLEVALEWGLASLVFRRRLAFVRLGASASWATVALLAFLAVARAMGCLALTGSALSEHLVLRVKNGVNAKQRGSKSLYCLICK